MDYVPTPSPVLFGHHFSSIAGAGPIVGPVLAALWFGWGPALLWILVGSVFIGSVHDYTALMASVRNRGMSLAEIGRKFFSPTSYYIMLGFIWLALVYVLIVFLDLTASTFAPDVSAIADVGVRAAAERSGGVVATASVFYIVLAVAFGVCVNRLKGSYKKMSMIFVPLVFVGIWIGTAIPLLPGSVPILLGGGAKDTWLGILLVYCLCAAVMPVYLLLQPRDYLSSFLLYACLAMAGVGLLLAGGSGGVAITWPFFSGWTHPVQGFLFPVLFVTVACGAVSGFHSLVASGTTAKQLNNERGAKSVAFGAMLVEGVLAVIAVSAVMIMKPGDTVGQPVIVFASALGRFGEALGLPLTLGTNFGKLAISTFLLTTLDTCTRLARFILDELLPWRFSGKRYASTVLTLVLPTVVVFMRIPHPTIPGAFIPAWQAVWPAFGATNQLLAAVALLVVVMWLLRERRKLLFAALPAAFMFVTAGWALILLVRQKLFTDRPDYLIGGLCLAMLIMAIYLLGDALNRVWRKA
jgi:carbon starvation protein